MSFNFIHTSDWHLGKKLYKKSRYEEQKLFLKWLEDCINENDVDLLLICGDIFDTPTPPNDAITLYFNFLNNISENTNCEVIIIPGNHDSAAFIAAPLEILKKHKISIITGIENYQQNNIIKINKNNESICVKALPYFRSFELINLIAKDNSNQQEQIECFIRDFFDYWPKGEDDTFKIIMAHHAFGSFLSSESEQALVLSGLDSIPESWLGTNFNYMALGHIHKPQAVKKDKNIYYSGSTIPLRFSEIHNKKINLIKVKNSKMELTTKTIPIFRPILQVKGTKENIYDNIIYKLEQYKESKLNAYLEVIVEMSEPDNLFNDKIFEMVKKQDAEILSYIPIYKNQKEFIEKTEDVVIYKQNIKDLFELYYKQKFPKSDKVPKKTMEYFIENLHGISDENTIY